MKIIHIAKYYITGVPR